MAADRAALALEAACRALARRDRSTAELDERLRRAGFSADSRGDALSRLRELGYLDDARFAASRASALAERGAGDDSIRFDLEQRGIDREVAEGAVRALEAETERARRLAAALGGGSRAARTLVRKGFAPESIESAVAAPDCQDAPHGVG